MAMELDVMIDKIAVSQSKLLSILDPVVRHSRKNLVSFDIIRFLKAFLDLQAMKNAEVSIFIFRSCFSS